MDVNLSEGIEVAVAIPANGGLARKRPGVRSHHMKQNANSLPFNDSIVYLYE